MINQTASLTWQTTSAGRVPVSDQFDDPYYSLKDGLAETQYVFLAGNDLPDRFGGDFHIGELGFGTGLNFLATWDAWIKQAREPREKNCEGRIIIADFNWDISAVEWRRLASEEDDAEDEESRRRNVREAKEMMDAGWVR